MKKWIRILTLFFVPTIALAAPPIIFFGNYSKLLTQRSVMKFDGQTLDSSGPINLVENNGFEFSTNNWTASGGTFAVTTTAANVGEGLSAGSWDSGSAGQTLTGDAVAIPAGYYSQNGLAFCRIQTPTGTATHTLNVYDGTNDISSVSVTSSTTYQYVYTNFVFPASGNIQLRLTSVAADEPSINIDSCYLGLATNLTNVSQAQFIGSAFIPTTANCNLSRSNTALGAFGTDADCPGPTVELNPGPGVIQTTDADLPRFTVNNLPPGNYKIMMSGSCSGTNAANHAFAINDGTNTRGTLPVTTGSGEEFPCQITADFSYTTTANRSFEMYCSASTGSCTLNNGTSNRTIYFHIYRYPSSSDQAIRLDDSAPSWSGYHASDCAFARTNTAYGDPASDASCTFTERTNQQFGSVTSYLSAGDELPGIVFTPRRAGKYLVCAYPKVQGSNVGETLDLELSDGTTVIAEAQREAEVANSVETVPLCGLLNSTNISTKTIRIETKATAGSVTIGANSSNTSSIEWEIIQIDQGFPMPIVVNSFVNGNNGQIRLESAEVSVTGVVSSETSDWISGNCALAASVFTCTLNSGRFSETPKCQVSITGTTAGEITVTPASSTSVVARSFDSTGAASDRAFTLNCLGQR